MQTVYVDVLIFLNIIIDFFILLCVKAILCVNIAYKRIIFGSIVGSLFSLVATLPNLNFFLNMLLGLIGAGVTVFVAFGKSSIANFLKRLSCFFAINFIFAGIMIAIYLGFKPNGMIIVNNVVYFNISPILLIILTLICYFILYIFRRLFLKQALNTTICKVKATIDNKDYIFNAKIDTGCDLKEPFSGSAVIVAEKCLFENLVLAEDQLRIIPFSSLGGEGIIKGKKAQQVEIDNKIIKDDTYIGFCENIFSGEIKALIPKELTGS